jgi:hemerythrin superfamily protein
MQIYEALKNDHDKVKMLLNQLIMMEEGSENNADLIRQIHDELIPHSRAEEAVFYNSLRTVDMAKDEVMHGYKEHMEAEALLRFLQMKEKVDLDWKSTAKKLKEALEHHIREEEGKIFSLAKQIFTEEEARQFAVAFEEMKPQIKEESFMGTTMELVKNLMPPKYSGSLRGISSSQMRS